MFSPRMWRWSWWLAGLIRLIKVFSTYVEVIPIDAAIIVLMFSFLHVCGGDPWSFESDWRWQKFFSTYVEVILLEIDCFFGSNGFSPRMWRWSQLEITSDDLIASFLHVCGGDPTWLVMIMKIHQFSPRMWRWSWWTTSTANWFLVFSTYVEVIPQIFHEVH